MTDREKAVVMAYTGFAMLTGEKLGIFYAYVREILGRPVWTHELAIKEVSAEIHEKSEKDFLELCASEDPKELPCQDETGMDERAVKVCNGLNCHVNGHPHTRCHKCPYWGTGPHGSSECSVLAADALALIRQQATEIHELQTKVHELQTVRMARVMLLEELDAIYQTREQHTWPFNTPPYLWMTVNPDVRQTRGLWICWRDIKYSLENDSPFYVRENYGKVWKIWTAEPTDEQIKEEAWKM